MIVFRLKDGENFNDTEEAIKKRIKTYNDETRPIIGEYSKFVSTVSQLYKYFSKKSISVKLSACFLSIIAVTSISINQSSDLFIGQS